jgi:hypothetical protein
MEKGAGKWWQAILGDSHFWTPLLVLCGGLAVLHWIR